MERSAVSHIWRKGAPDMGHPRLVVILDPYFKQIWDAPSLRNPGSPASEACWGGSKGGRPQLLAEQASQDDFRQSEAKWRDPQFSKHKPQIPGAPGPDSGTWDSTNLETQEICGRSHCYRPLAKIARSSCGGTTSSWAKVQSLGFLSVRHLRKCAMWRKRPPCMCS